MKLTILMPAYNEERTILQILRRIAECPVEGVEYEILVVDDGSRDDTVKLLEVNPELFTRLIKMPQNGGKGAAVKAGLAEATGDYILFQDADLEYDPADYEKLLLPVKRFGADVVMGSRFLAPQYTRVFYFFNKIGNFLITLTFNLINNTTWTDIYSCYLMYKRDLVDPAELRSEGWEQHAEILSLAAARGSNLYEVPISYHGRTYEEGKKIRAHHIIGVIWMILSQRLRRMFN